MARVDTPSYIKTPGGRMGDAVFYTVGSRTYMRCYVIPRNPKTPLQQKNRSLFAEAMASWKSLPDEEKYVYKKRTMTLNMLPHNLFISEYIRARKQQELQPGSGVPGNTPAGSVPTAGGVQHISPIAPLFFRCRTEASPLYSICGTYSVPESVHCPLYHPRRT